MNNISTQGKGFDMKPLIGGAMSLLMVAVIAQLVQAEETANLSGCIRDSDNGALLDGANVSLNGYTTTTVNGYYSFTGLAPGSYSLTVSKTGYLMKTLAVVLVAGDNIQDVALIPFTEEDLAQLSGVVKDSVTGAALEGVAIALDSDETTTDAFGIYTFKDKEPGSYTLVASKDGYTTQTRSIYLAVGDNTEDILLTPEGLPEAEFEVSDLTITPSVVNVGEPVEISALVENVGTAAGSYVVNCDISPETYTPLAVVPAVTAFGEMINAAIAVTIMGVVTALMVKSLPK